MTKPNSMAALSLCLLAGCLYDANDLCGPGEMISEATSTCVCADNHVPVVRDISILVPTNPTAEPPRAGCEACGTNEEAVGNECKCVAGFVRGANGCVESNLGASCASDADCAVGDNTYCRLPDGYCTSTGCASSDECNVDADYACDASEATAFCRRPPVGEGAVCSGQGPDPACSAEAPICASGTCHVAACVTDDDCSPSRDCCDLSAFTGQSGFTLCMAGGCP